MFQIKVAFPALVLAGLLAVGCKSQHEEGVTSNYRTQWAPVAASTKATTDAAASVLTAESLKDVVSESTDVDGVASAKKADGTVVKVHVKKKGDGSELAVTVGTIGDPVLGAELTKKIKAKAEMK